MISFIFIFEVSDKIPGISSIYFYFIVLGIIGLVFGCLRWWLGAVWIFILSNCGFAFLIIDNDIIDAIIQEKGNSYIIHRCLAPFVAIIFTGAGMYINSRKNVLSDLV
jgi:hypothetical protein